MATDFLVERWVWSALTDLYFGFYTERYSFMKQARFHELMGMEKFIKGLVIFSEMKTLRCLPEHEALTQSDFIARKLGHNVKKQLQRVGQVVEPSKIDRLITSNFDGYSGEELIFAMQKGYMEYRYPMPEPVYKSFPSIDPSTYRDPLGSSGITKFVYRVCNICFQEMKKETDFQDILESFQNWFGSDEQFNRFNQLFWEHKSEVLFNSPFT